MYLSKRSSRTLSPGTVSPCSHQFRLRLSRLPESLIGFTTRLICAKGSAKRAASLSVMVGPKSTIQVSLDRLAMSCPLAHGRSISAFDLPLGFGLTSHWRACAPGMSKAPTLTGPWNAMPAFSLSGIAVVRSRSALPPRSAVMRGAVAPFSCAWQRDWPKQIIDTRTAAPSLIQGSSAHASKMRLSRAMASSTARLAPRRMACVATNPAASRPAIRIARRALSNQKQTRSTPPDSDLGQD